MKKLIFLFLLIPIIASGQITSKILPSLKPPSERIALAYDANQPLNIEDECKVWLDGKDAGQFTLDGTYVDDWIGKGSLGVHVVNTNDNTTRPTYDINTGRVAFTAANETYLQSAAFGVLTEPNTVFVVYKNTGALNAAQCVFDGGGGALDRDAFIMKNSKWNIFGSAYLADGASDNNDNIHVGLFNGASSEYWINGVSVVSGDAGTGIIEELVIGGLNANTYNVDAEIMEVIVFGADISDVDRDKITGYLANKWSITATTDFKGYVLYEIMWLILILIPNIRRKEEEFKIAA